MRRPGELVIYVKLWVEGLPKSHPVTLALLVLLAFAGAKGGAALELGKAAEEVRIEVQVAGLGVRALSRPHTPNGEGARDQIVAKGQDVGGGSPEESDHHVTGDSEAVRALCAHDASEAACQAEVGPRARDRRGEVCVTVAGDDRVHNALESGVGSTHRGKVP